MSSFKKLTEQSSQCLPEKSAISNKKKQSHRRTQSNSDFSTDSNQLINRLSTPQHLEKTLIKVNSFNETNISQTTQDQETPNINKKPSVDKQVIIETLDLTPQEQMKLAGTAGYGTLNLGFFRFGKKRTFENCPKYLELMLSGCSNTEEKQGDLSEFDISPLKDISINYNMINEESMETESHVSKSSLCFKPSISKQKRDSLFKSDFLGALEEVLMAENSMNKLMRPLDSKMKMRKKGHSKSCFGFNLLAFNLKLKNYFENKKSVSIKKNEIMLSDCISKRNSSQTNSIVNFTKQKLRKKSDESLMINKINSSFAKHKKTSTSVFNPVSKIPIIDKHDYLVKIQEFEKKIKEMESIICLLNEKTKILENENKSLSCRIIDVSKEKKDGDLEKEEYKKSIKELERRIKDNEKNIKKIFNLMIQPDSTRNSEWKQNDSVNSITHLELSLCLPSIESTKQIDGKSLEIFNNNVKFCSIPNTPNSLINSISAGGDNYKKSSLRSSVIPETCKKI